MGLAACVHGGGGMREITLNLREIKDTDMWALAEIDLMFMQIVEVNENSWYG